MVQREHVRKKPKYSVLVSKDGLPAAVIRGAGEEEVCWRRHYADGVPRRAGGRERDAVRAKVVFAGGAPPPYVSTATCSSAMKGLGLGLPGGAAHVCPYSYCSFKGHVDASVVPLRILVASRRQLIKTQQSMKLKGASPFRKASTSGGADGFFVEMYSGRRSRTGGELRCELQ